MAFVLQPVMRLHGGYICIWGEAGGLSRAGANRVSLKMKSGSLLRKFMLVAGEASSATGVDLPGGRRSVETMKKPAFAADRPPAPVAGGFSVP